MEEEFKDKRTKNGWVLNLVKVNDIHITSSLYDDGGSFVESKTFNLNYENDMDILRKYIELFEEKTYELDADIKNEILAILAENKTAYMLDDNVSDDKNMLISDRVTDGQETLFFTTEEAWEELNKDYDKVNETLVIWLLRLW